MDQPTTRRTDPVAPGELTLTLTFLDGQVTDSLLSAVQLRDATAQTAARIAALEQQFGISGPVIPSSRTRGIGAHQPVDWQDFVGESRARLAERGIDVDQLTLDTFLDSDEVRHIERRFGGSFRLETRLDRDDVIAAIVAGAAGALTDVFIVGIPRALRDKAFPLSLIAGPGPLATLLKAVELPHDNALSGYVKVSYDRVVKGTSGPDHRSRTPGHDPLLGLVFGTLDVLRGQMTWIDNVGRWRVEETMAPVEGVLGALVLQMGHTLSDAFTVMGVPAPGWTMLGLLDVEAPGPSGQTIASVARRMYLDGHDARFALALRSAPAATDVVLRAYAALRGADDVDFAADLRSGLGDADGISCSARFEAMSFIAHFVACAANAGKVSLLSFGGLNHQQWLAFISAGIRLARTQRISPAEVVGDRARANLAAIADGWPPLDSSVIPDP